MFGDRYFFAMASRDRRSRNSLPDADAGLGVPEPIPEIREYLISVQS